MAIDDDGMYDYVEYHSTLISTAKDSGAIQKHQNVLDPRYLTSVKGKSETESQTFCCSYTEKSDIGKEDRSFMRERTP